MPDRLTGMHIFVRVAATGSLSAAARALGMSQSGVTKHVAALEDRLGARLFHRSTRRMTLTEAGRRYLEACERILAEIDEAEAAAGAEAAEPRGTLRLNVPVSFGVLQVAPALAEFGRAYPALTVELGLNDRPVDLIEEGWDLALRIGDLRDSSLVARALARCRMCVCAAPSYLAAQGRPRRPADLAAHNCLGYTLASSDGWRFEGGTATVAGSLRASNGAALVAAAAAGLGVIYQPTFLVAEALRRGSLVALDLGPIPTLPIHAVMPSRRRPPAKVRVMVEFAARRFADPPWDRDLPAPLGIDDPLPEAPTIGEPAIPDLAAAAPAAARLS
ncbi:LysR family transcriptional regulator [Methylobacterium nonmethylotrophicum]|uniref:LysR family transcriptional regulator n=1 Tax=Methylobacterium nonmethylotrophicum TaxID=1141884 RepID=A0A4Z0NXZ0_9HYPH|nr:LysR family transcriptional regulator [Methylobacterium nonmethylotrophicum]TGE02525.1 LysR family transcriptional regulator [Methylobacterium nonmethylotrophicum]